VENLTINGNFSVYPNPASTQVTIETSSTPAKSQLSVWDVFGKQIIRRNFTETKMKIDISNLPSGVYFVRLTGEKTMQMWKFMKQ